MCLQGSATSLSWASWMQSVLSHSISLTSIVMLSSHIHLGLPNCSFLQVFHQNPTCISICPAHMLFRFDHSNNNLRFNDHEAPHYAISQSPVSCFFLIPKDLSSSPYSQTLSAHILPITWETKLGFMLKWNMRQLHSSLYFSVDTLEIAGRKTRHSLNLVCS